MNSLSSLVVTCCLAIASTSCASLSGTQEVESAGSMQLGNFSVSLSVKDIHASRAFYEKLDFVEVGGDIAQNWLVLQNGTTTVGLFQGMFEENLMTFNPGWTHTRATPESFQDVREIQSTLRERGLSFSVEADESTSGAASFMIADPDGNTILFDQHVASPE
ncbi:MAG: lactoylglutathione lyase [Gammaproteobacteria bacterium]|jgi:lactoylglutathione lyase